MQESSRSSAVTPCYVARAKVRQQPSTTFMQHHRYVANAGGVNCNMIRTELLSNGYPDTRQHVGKLANKTSVLPANKTSVLPTNSQQNLQHQQPQQRLPQQQQLEAKDSVPVLKDPVSRVASVNPTNLYNGGGRGSAKVVLRKPKKAMEPSPMAGGNNSQMQQQSQTKNNPYQYQQQAFSTLGTTSKRHGLYLPGNRVSLAALSGSLEQEVFEANKKPPLPPQPLSAASSDGGASSNQPRPPPRTRPKSWTSSLFNAMHCATGHHKSVNFQSVLLEESSSLPLSSSSDSSCLPQKQLQQEGSLLEGPSRYQVSDAPPTPIMAAHMTDEVLMRIPKPRSRTPSPFRAIIKGLMKGTKPWTLMSKNACTNSLTSLSSLCLGS